jgi:hypothetical protein
LKVVYFMGTHPRHAHMARIIGRLGFLSGLVVEAREMHVPSPPEGLRPSTRALFTEHFRLREEAEHRFFGSSPDHLEELAPRVLRVPLADLNGLAVQRFLSELAPDLILSYGVHKLLPETLSHARRQAWNIHGGLSPWYRGATTHFWPSYMLEPQMTGVTLHVMSQVIDAGDIVHQNAASLHRQDGLHDLACRSVHEFGLELPHILTALANATTVGLPVSPQRTTGKFWRASEWRPEHLHLIYELYGDRVVAHTLDGGPFASPRLFRDNFPT